MAKRKSSKNNESQSNDNAPEFSDDAGNEFMNELKGQAQEAVQSQVRDALEETGQTMEGEQSGLTWSHVWQFNKGLFHAVTDSHAENVEDLKQGFGNNLDETAEEIDQIWQDESLNTAEQLWETTTSAMGMPVQYGKDVVNWVANDEMRDSQSDACEVSEQYRAEDLADAINSGAVDGMGSTIFSEPSLDLNDIGGAATYMQESELEPQDFSSPFAPPSLLELSTPFTPEIPTLDSGGNAFSEGVTQNEPWSPGEFYDPGLGGGDATLGGLESGLGGSFSGGLYTDLGEGEIGSGDLGGGLSDLGGDLGGDLGSGLGNDDLSGGFGGNWGGSGDTDWDGGFDAGFDEGED